MAVERLKRRPEFLRVRNARRSHAAPGLVLQARQQPDAERAGSALPVPRVGFTASKKVGNAVERNRARRRLRAAVDAVIPLHAAPGYDYVVIARSATLRRPFSALIEDLSTALQRLGTWRDALEPTDGQPERRAERHG